MKTVEMAGVLAEVGGAINHFGLQVSKKAGIEFEEAQQEIMIAAWQSATRYRPKTAGCELKKWIMTDIYFKSRDMVDRAKKRMEAMDRVLPLIYPLIPEHTEDHAEAVITKVDSERREAKLHPALRQILSLSRLGFRQKEIGKQMGKSEQWVSWAVRNLVEIG